MSNAERQKKYRHRKSNYEKKLSVCVNVLSREISNLISIVTRLEAVHNVYIADLSAAKTYTISQLRRSNRGKK